MENPEAGCRVLCTHFTLDTRRLLPILSLLPVSAASAQPPAFCNSSTSPVVIGSIRYRLDTLSRIISGNPSKSGNHTIASPIWNWWGLTRCCIQPSDRDRAVSQPPSNQEKDRPLKPPDYIRSPDAALYNSYSCTTYSTGTIASMQICRPTFTNSRSSTRIQPNALVAASI
ncbi:hypothetical protein IG631_22303 [Alternaria alternata]|nr:hypothetical protein IG631_22303 [Alternaria alternata]